MCEPGDNLNKWSDTCLLAFHPHKCKVSDLGNRTDEAYEYTLDQTLLNHTQSENDLGVVINNKLKCSEHMNEKVNMGVIRQSFKFLDCKSFMKLYIGLVRLYVEYAVAVWNSHLIKDIKRVEKVQRRATKQINSIKEMSYEERLKQLKLPTLVYRRMRGDVIRNSRYETISITQEYPISSQSTPM